LYYFAREYNRRGDLAMARRIGDALFQRFGRHAERRIRRARFRHDDAQETLWNLRAEFWGELLCDDGSEFWEVRFWVALDRRLYRILKRERRFATVRLEAESEVSWQDRLQDRRPGPETLAVRRDALQWLTQRETKTLALIYEKGMPVEPGNLAATSVASELGVTGRTVRNYLRSARRKIRDWIAEGQTTP
jgi:DNA-binding CsgD family transcriptional regulator